MVDTIGIVGAASIGVSVLGNIVDTVASGPDPITLIDPRPPGAGPVFNCENSLILCNTSAAIGSLLPHKPSDFLNYLASCGRPTNPEAFTSRDVVSEYTRARYTEYVARAAVRGCEVRHHRGRVRSVRRREGGGYEVHLDDGVALEFDRIVICVGFASAKIADGITPYIRHPRVVLSPYPGSLLRQRVTGTRSRVLILGTRLSAIDAALVLCDAGHQVTMASRSGALPSVRNRMLVAPVNLPSLDRIGDLALDDPLVHRKLTRIVIEAVRAIAPIPLRQQLSSAVDPVPRLREEVELALAGRCVWQDVWGQLLDRIIAWTGQMPLRAREHLLSPYRTLIWQYGASMPVGNAQKLLQHIDAGRLKLARYDPARVAADHAGFDVGLRHGEYGRFDFVVNAVGYNYPRLYAQGDTLHLNDAPPNATVIEHLETSLRVRMTPTAPAENIWLVGPTTHINNPFANYLRGSVAQAAHVTAQLVASPQSHAPSESAVLANTTW